MNTGGFGFSFGAPRDDDDENDNSGNRGGKGEPFDPFSMLFGSAGGRGGDGRNPLEDMLSGLGGMFTPQGEDDPDAPYLDVEAVRRHINTMLRDSGTQSEPASQDSAAVQEATRLAELWLDANTDFPTSGAVATAWSVKDYATTTLPFWLRLAEPARKAVGDTPVVGLGDQTHAAEFMSAINQFMRRQNQAMENSRVASALVELAQSVISGTDLGFPATPTSTISVLTRSFRDDIKGLDIPDQEALVYLCAREAARQRLFSHVGWLSESLVASVEEWAAGAFVDTSHVEEFMRDHVQNIEAENFAELAEKMQSIDPENLTPRLISSNENAAPRIETLLALIEGWVDTVVGEAVADRLPHADQLRTAWRRRRESGGTGATALKAITGVTIGTPPVDDAVVLWERTTNAVGATRRDACWEHPDLVPSPEELAHPARFIDRLLDEALDQDFDPIAEIEALEKQLGSSEIDPESRENPHAPDNPDTKD